MQTLLPSRTIDLSLVAIAILLAWPFLLSAPLLIGGAPTRLLFIMVATPCIALLALTSLRREAPPSLRGSLFLAGFAVFAIVGAAAALRADPAMLQGQARIGLAATTLLLFGMGATAFRTKSRDGLARRLSALTFALPLYVAFNLALYLIFGPEWIEPARPARFVQENDILHGFGIALDRVGRLGLIRGPNTLGLMAGIGVVLMGCRLAWDQRGRPLSRALLAANAAALVLAEARGAMAAAALSLAIFYGCRKKGAETAARAATIFAAFSPFVLAPMIRAVGMVGIGPALIRQAGNGEALGIGTGRPMMLDTGTAFLSRFDVEQIWGYGHYGHIASGASRPFEWIFGGDPGRSSFHNAMLQSVFDIGYAGTALFLLLLWQSIKIIGRTRMLDPRAAKAMLAALLFVIITGYTEVTGTLYHLEMYGLMFALFGLAATLACARTMPLSPRERWPDAGVRTPPVCRPRSH